MNPFQIGDEVIFHQNTMTVQHHGINKYMMEYLHEEAVLTVIRLGVDNNGIPFVVCQAPQSGHWNYHPEDLKLSDNRTEDEKYLDNLLRGVK